MTLAFECPRCGKSLKAPEGAAGKTAECKFCHTKITIPAVEAMKRQGQDADRLAFDLISSSIRTREKVPRAVIVSESLTHEYMQARKGYSPTLQKAIWLYECQLQQQAQFALIDHLVDGQVHPLEMSAGMYLLGLISFEQGKFHSALRVWQTLIEEFPESYEGKIVVDRLAELEHLTQGKTTQYIDEARASMYLRNGDFWTTGRNSEFVLDTSYINNIEAALHWYDKAIVEFPKSAAARLAHEQKLRTLIGWKNPNDFGMAYGAVGEFSEYIPRVLEAFAAFEKEFPDTPTLQPLRFQIAQLYWNNKDFVNTERWLRAVISSGNDQDSFYSDLADRRLRKLSASI